LITEKRERTMSVESQIENPYREYVEYEKYRRMKDIS
jgi:hypothetical protein